MTDKKDPRVAAISKTIIDAIATQNKKAVPDREDIEALELAVAVGLVVIDILLPPLVDAAVEAYDTNRNNTRKIFRGVKTEGGF